MIFSKTKVLDCIAKGLIKIEPLSNSNFGIASYSLSLELPASIILQKGDFLTIKTTEKITLSPKIACIVSTRGSAASKGINASQSSFFCEPDTDNKLTLEVSYGGPEPLVLEPGASIAKVVFVGVE